MKLFIATLLIASSAFALVLPKTLGQTMKAMSGNLKIISAHVDDSKANANAAVLSDEFVQLTLHAKTFTPDSIKELPAEQQPAAKTDYDRELDLTADLGKQLANAFRANDNALATTLLDRLANAKKDGHKKFK